MERLGLQRSKVEILPSQSSWRQSFIKEKGQIVNQLKNIEFEIEHVGSTSVIGLSAKPIIDIAIGIEDDIDLQTTVDRLKQIGWIDRGGNINESNGHLLVRETAPEFRTHHIHIVKRPGEHWRNYIRFRDTLRENVKIREEYEKVKIELAGKHANNRTEYREAKSKYLNKLIEKVNMLD